MSADQPDRPRTLLPLPGRVSDDHSRFHRCLAEVLAATGGELPPGPGPDPLDEYRWEHAARRAVVTGLRQAGPWPEPVFGALMRAAVHDPNPSFNRQLIDPALAARGRRAVMEALLGLFVHGTNAEKAGAARAWYWAQIPLDGPGRREFRKLIAAGTPENPVAPEAALAAVNALGARWREITRRELAPAREVAARWREASLREFVANDDLDVRRCLIPGLDLRADRCPADLRDLVTAAVRIARAHPDEYIRHRVKHQT